MRHGRGCGAIERCAPAGTRLIRHDLSPPGGVGVQGRAELIPWRVADLVL